jgi:HemY protein
MKRLLLALGVATVMAFAIGLVAYYFGPGYVVLSFADLSIEASFIFALAFMAVGFFVFYYLLRLLSLLFRMPDYLGLRYSHRQAEKARNALVKGLIEMSEGRFSQAEKILLKQVNHSDTGLLNYLIAARSAQMQGAYERRDEYLRLAHETTPSADIAIGITQAELQIAHNQNEQALATLNHLSTIAPKHAYVKKLQGRVYEQLGDWDSLAQVLDDVRKSRLVDDSKLEEMEVSTYSGLLNQAIKQKDLQKINETWQRVPKKLRENKTLLKQYLCELMKYKADDQAEPLLRTFLSHHWDESMVLMYAQLNSSNPQRQLETAETWLHGHSRSAELLLALGKLCIKCKLWGKARNYLESSLGIKPQIETYQQLANLLQDKMDDTPKAQEYYKKGLELAVAELHGLPQPGDDINLPGIKDGTPVLKLIQ